MTISRDLERFLRDVENNRVQLQGADALTADQILDEYADLMVEEVAAIVARSDADLIRVGAPYKERTTCRFSCTCTCGGMSCGRTG